MRGWGEGLGRKTKALSINASTETSPKVGIRPQIFITFIFNLFTTLV